MARIVLALGTSHTPQLSAPVEVWPDFGARDRANPELLGPDGRYHTYAGLEALVPPLDPEELAVGTWRERHARAQAGIEALAAALAAAAPDVVVVIGDDQGELFLDDVLPAFAIVTADHVVEIPPTGDARARIPADVRAGLWAFHGERPERYPVPAELARHAVEHLTLDGFDVATVARQPDGRTLGHAFTFVRRRLLPGDPLPLLPVAVNTYYPPNQPTPRRSLAFGRALRRAIEAWPADATVAVVASGGLSHFVVDEALDRRVLDALCAHDTASLATIPRDHLRSGSSEILNWIALAGATEHLALEVVDYLPAYRTPARTGVGIAFVRSAPDGTV